MASFIADTFYLTPKKTESEEVPLAQIGTGQTSAQMIQAPHGALYLVPDNGDRTYFKKLADYLGRKDLWIRQPRHIPTLLGNILPNVVLDHATVALTPQEVAGLARLIRTKSPSP